MTDPAAPQQPLQLSKGVVKQVLSGDSIIVRGQPRNGPPPEKQINFSNILAPRLARRPTPNSETEVVDEPYAWEAREFLRKKLIGVEVYFSADKPANSTRYYGTVFLGPDATTAVNVTELLVAEGLASVRRENSKAPEVAKLAALEDQAKAAGKGKWGGNPAEHVRHVKWTQENPRAIVEQKNGKALKAIIEHVRDGSTVRAFLLPDFYYVTIMISGIRCPGVKLDADGRPDPTVEVPFAEEGRYFVESNFLQRDVEVILDSVNNSNFVGTIRVPEGNIAECLLMKGFGKCVDWSMAFMKNGADKLRAAEKFAKENRLRVWKDYKSNVQVFTGKEKEFAGTVVEIHNGDSISVKAAGGAIKKVFLSSIRAPREANRVVDEEGKMPARPKNFRPLFDIPWMYEAREFLRKELIGKKVNCVLDYVSPARDTMPERNCYTVTINNKNMAVALINQGLAHVIRYRQDDDQRSQHYDALMTAEAEAISAQKGVHSKKGNPVHRINDLTVDHSRLKTQYLPSWQRALRNEAIVEFVASGSRFRMLMPKESCLVTFLVGGISCPRSSRANTATGPAQEGDPYGDDALAYSRDRVLHRDVSVRIESTDKAGAAVIGWLFIGNTNLSVALVEEGLATVHFSAEKSEYYRALKAAEDKAKAKRKRIWTNWVEPTPEELAAKEEALAGETKTAAAAATTAVPAAGGEGLPIEKERPKKYEQVVVTEVTAELNFYAQSVEKGPALDAMMAKMRAEFISSPPLAGSYTAKKGDLCAAKFSADNEWYRAKVERVQGKNVHVLFVDYGNKEILDVSRITLLPPAFKTERPFTTEYSLALITLPPDEDDKAEAVKVFSGDVLNRTMLLHLEYEADNKCAILVEPSTQNDVGERLIKEGYVLANRAIKNPRVRSLKNTYSAAETEAKKTHAGIWEYGDVGIDDAPEFGNRK